MMDETPMVERRRPRGRMRITDLARGWQLIAVTMLLLAVVLHVAPQQLGLVAYKGSLISGAAMMAYWIDRVIFHRARPGIGELDHWGEVHAMYRRAIIMGCAMIAAGLAA